MNKPPFEINENILELVVTITKKMTHLEIDAKYRKDLLRKASRIKSVTYSCAIEANNLSEDDVINVLNNKIVIAPKKEIIEVRNAYDAYNKMNEYDPYKTESLLAGHRILMTNLIEESGKFRNRDVGVFEGGRVIHTGARPEYISTLVKELFDWGRTSELNPLIKSSIIHFEIEFIHPFSDGNGRIGRLWQSLILCNYNSLFEYLPIETLVHENQQKYYNALSLSEKEGKSTAFIEFMLDMILKTIEKYADNNSIIKIKGEYIKGLTKMQKEVLIMLVTYFETDVFFDMNEAYYVLNKSKVNIRKYFSNFIKLNILITIGKNKGRKYKVNSDIIEDNILK